jgi:hypothetical protein
MSPLATLPQASVETEFVIVRAFSCRAIAAALSSRTAVTAKASIA